MNRTVQFGEGLFETILWKGENKKLRLHYSRLKSSAEFFSIPCPTYEEFLESIRTAVGGATDIYVKYILLSEGPDHYGAQPEGYRVEIKVREAPRPPETVDLCFSSYRRHSANPLFRHKTTSYLFNVLVKREAVRRGYFDGVVLNERGEVTECSASNLILLKRDRLYTPARESGLLWGTTLELLSQSFDIREEYLKPGDLLRADSIFLTNSLIGVVPVLSLEGKKKEINGEALRELKKAFL